MKVLVKKLCSEVSISTVWLLTYYCKKAMVKEWFSEVYITAECLMTKYFEEGFGKEIVSWRLY